MPAEGVYAGWVVSGARVYPAAINVGAPRTFSDDKRPSFLEAHLLGFSGDLYDADVAVLFVAWLRAARSFASTAELEQVVLSNIEWVRNKLGQDACNLGERHVLDVARTAAITVVGKGQA
jgi:riboflavin kinase/FMN adenylyltransferase